METHDKDYIPAFGVLCFLLGMVWSVGDSVCTGKLNVLPAVVFGLIFFFIYGAEHLRDVGK
ncbi:MAG: hypothetical protein QM762_12595 [Chryseolinea sp.]